MGSSNGIDPPESAEEARLERVWSCLEEGDWVTADGLVGELLARWPTGLDVLLAASEVALARAEPEAARRFLEKALGHHPMEADAHYAMARWMEVDGDRAGMIRHDLMVEHLDGLTVEPRRLGQGRTVLRRLIEEEAEATLMGLPSPLRERLTNVAVVLEDRPPRALVREGFDPRSLGLFEGADDHHQRAGEPTFVLTRIVLFTGNLLAQSRDREDLREQVRVTILHEIGHFFGLDEDQVAALGLA